MSVLDKKISYYPSINDTKRGITVNLLQLLRSTKHEVSINSLRAESDPLIQKQLKDKLPCYTVSGEFNRRCEEGLISSSGLAAVDLDSAEDYDVMHLLQELKKIPYMAYIGLSCRGKRLFAIVPFLNPDKYARQYERLIRSFEDIGLPMGDTCHKAISQPRFVSYNTDDTCYFNHYAKPYHLLPPEKTYHTIRPFAESLPISFQSIPEDLFKWCDTQVQKSHSFTVGQRHAYIVRLVRYCNIKGLTETDTLNGCVSTYGTEDFDEHEITLIVQYIFSTQTVQHNTLPFKTSSQDDLNKDKLLNTSLLLPESLTSSLQGNSFIIPPPTPPDEKHLYFGADGLLYTHVPGLPDLQ
jgi:hypothetical protein